MKAHECPFSIQWDPIWNPMRVHSVSHENPFSIPWVPFQHPIRAHLASSEKPFGILWEPIQHLMRAHSASHESPFSIPWVLIQHPMSAHSASHKSPFGMLAKLAEVSDERMGVIKSISYSMALTLSCLPEFLKNIVTDISSQGEMTNNSSNVEFYSEHVQFDGWCQGLFGLCILYTMTGWY